MKTLIKTVAMSFALTGALTGLATVMSAPAFAQAIEPARIMIVDVAAIKNECTAGKDAGVQLTAKRNALQDRTKSLTDQFAKEADALRGQQGVMDQAGFEAKAADFDKRRQAAGQDVAKQEQDLQRSYQYVNGKIEEAMYPIIKELMTQRNATIVMDTTQTLMIVGSNDVSKTVIERLNVKLPKLASIIPPAAPAPAPKK
jgi:outer membrane protein